MTLLLAAALLASRASAAAPAAAPKVSTATASGPAVSTATIGSIYTGDRYRDPFLATAMGGRAASDKGAKKESTGEPAGPEVVDIHGLSLRGLMQDDTGDGALFAAESGATYLLRKGKLYNERNKQVPGITGRVKFKQKTVELMTPDKDVQPFHLGEEPEKDKDSEKKDGGEKR